jgi:hypothetical protein
MPQGVSVRVRLSQPIDYMQVIFVEKPYQKADGDQLGWTVQDEMLKVNESFQEWLTRKKERIAVHDAYKDVKGLYIYDMSPLVGMNCETGMSIRFAYIR